MTPLERATRLTDDALAMVVEWQRAAGTREVCGLCAVDQRGRQQMLLLTNHAGLPDSFEIYPSEELMMRAAAAERSWTIVAFVHTHPHHGPEMSPPDAMSFARDTLPWIIVGTPTGAPRQETYLHSSTSSTRRFFARPSSLLFEATGEYGPFP